MYEMCNVVSHAWVLQMHRVIPRQQRHMHGSGRFELANVDHHEWHTKRSREQALQSIENLRLHYHVRPHLSHERIIWHLLQLSPSLALSLCSASINVQDKTAANAGHQHVLDFYTFCLHCALLRRFALPLGLHLAVFGTHACCAKFSCATPRDSKKHST